MAILKKMLKQTGVLWRATGTDMRGQREYGEPEEIKIRWEDKVAEFTDNDGARVLSVAVVYVDRDVKPDDMIVESTLAALTDYEELNPLEAGAFKIRRAEKLPNLKNKQYLRTCYL